MYKSSYIFCLLAVVLLRLSEASHFRGATIQWSPVYSNDINGTQTFNGLVRITHQISWTRSSSEGGNCDRSVIQFQRLLGGRTGKLSCRTGCVGDIGTMDYFCTDFSLSEDWSAGRRSYQYDSAGVTYLEASFSSGAWANLVIGGGAWEVRVSLNLTERADTGRVNSSPITVFSPDNHIQHGCNHTIRIPVFDVDGDTIRCRWAVANRGECAGVCQAFPADLSSNTCTLQYEATGPQGLYAIALQVEDFASPTDTQPLSSVPIQFLLEVFDFGLECDALVEFVGETPADGSCIGVPSKGTYRGRITARATQGNQIEEIATISPIGLQKTNLMKGAHPLDWFVDVEWTPDASVTGPNIFCFEGHDNNGVVSQQSCITLSAGAKAPEFVPGTLLPMGLINQTNHIEWTVEFDAPFHRPSTSKFIHVMSEGLEVMSIDVSRTTFVDYPETDNSRQLRFQTTYSFMEGVNYYILMDSGVAVSEDSCVTNSPAIINSNQWNVSIIVSDPCQAEPCDTNADCERLNLLSRNFTCACKPGFTGDGLSCSVPDPCLGNPCDVNADCLRDSLLNELFSCVCRTPFQGTGVNCSIPDPCALEPCDIDANCTREGLLSSNFSCMCQDPFVGDGFNCTIPNPCLFGPCDANATCTQLGLKSEEFTCECDLKFFGDGFNCTGTQTAAAISPQLIAIAVVMAIVLVSLIIFIGILYGSIKVVLTLKKIAKGDTNSLL